MVDLQDAYEHRPFPYPDKEYLMAPTEPILLLPFSNLRCNPCFDWAMSSCPIHPVDTTRTGSPTNIANESVFLSNSESETREDDSDNEDLSPTVLPYAYASPSVYNVPRESRTYDFDSSDDDMSFDYNSSSSDSSRQHLH